MLNNKKFHFPPFLVLALLDKFIGTTEVLEKNNQIQDIHQNIDPLLIGGDENVVFMEEVEIKQENGMLYI